MLTLYMFLNILAYTSQLLSGKRITKGFSYCKRKHIFLQRIKIKSQTQVSEIPDHCIKYAKIQVFVTRIFPHVRQDIRGKNTSYST